jgi:hypothetical protein
MLRDWRQEESDGCCGYTEPRAKLSKPGGEAATLWHPVDFPKPCQGPRRGRTLTRPTKISRCSRQSAHLFCSPRTLIAMVIFPESGLGRETRLKSMPPWSMAPRLGRF